MALGIDVTRGKSSWCCAMGEHRQRSIRHL